MTEIDAQALEVMNLYLKKVNPKDSSRTLAISNIRQAIIDFGYHQCKKAISRYAEDLKLEGENKFPVRARRFFTFEYLPHYVSDTWIAPPEEPKVLGGKQSTAAPIPSGLMDKDELRKKLKELKLKNLYKSPTQ
jgi:hypothetical protein